MNIIDDMEAIQKRLAEIEKAKLSADEMASLDTEGKLSEPGWPVPAITPPASSLTFPEVPAGWHPPLALYCDKGEIIDLYGAKGEIVDLTASDTTIWPHKALARYQVQQAEARIRLYMRLVDECRQELSDAKYRLAEFL